MKSKVYQILYGLNKMKWSTTFKGVLSGVVVGLLVVLYRFGIEFGYERTLKIYSYLRIHPMMILPWICIAAMAGLFLHWLIKYEPMGTGSGIPQVEGLLLYGLKMKWFSILCVRFLGGILSSFFGTSLGREGPLIQIGASGSQALAKKISQNKLEENYLITGGAAAGLSAAFNAPLSGIMFALEEVHRSFSPILLIAATTASLTADVVSKYFFGLKPILSFMNVTPFPQKYYLLLLPLGVLAGFIGVLMNKALLKIQLLYNRIPAFLRPFTALMVALPCGLIIPEVLGGGQNLIQKAESGQIVLTMLLVFLVVKIIFTCMSFGSGIPGGIFMPILSVGALTGSIFGMAASSFGVSAEYIPGFCVCAMAGALSASVKAPITSILLLAEMTGSLVHLLPVAMCSFTALLLSDVLKVEPIYEALLERITHNNEKIINGSRPGALLELPVDLGSEVCGKKIGEVQWPDGTLVVGIHRGNKEITPNGSTKMINGDYLVVLSSENEYGDMSLALNKMCHA